METGDGRGQADTAATPLITRGPYLQSGSPSNITVRWRTDQATNSRVRYGVSPGSLNLNADTPALSTEHDVTLSGLAADTTYQSSVETRQTSCSGDGADKCEDCGEAHNKPTDITVIGLAIQ